MSQTLRPYGFRVVEADTGAIRTKSIPGGISAAYGSVIPIGSVVALNTSGTLELASITGPVAGVFAGCTYRDATGILQTGGWPGSSGNTDITATYYPATADVTLSVQATGPIAQAGIGDQANLSNPSAGGVQTGSQQALNPSLVGTGNTGQFAIIGLLPKAGNAWGDAYTEVLVKFNQRQQGPASVVAV